MGEPRAAGYPLDAVEEMYLEGLELKRQQLRRENPGATCDEIERLVMAWIADRPMDAPGTVRRL